MVDHLDELFIPPGENIVREDERVRALVSVPNKDELQQRWKTRKGRAFLEEWKQSKFDRKILTERIGKHYDHFDLRGITLAGEYLADTDLSVVDFYGADLSKARMERCNLSHSWLSETDLKGTKFDSSAMNSVYIDNAEVDDETSFMGVDLVPVNWNLSPMIREMATTQQRIANLEKHHKAFAWFVRVTCDYGRSITRLFGVTVLFILTFMGIYWANGVQGLSALQLSVEAIMPFGSPTIALPAGVSPLVRLAETVCGFVFSSLLIAIFTRRMIGP